MDNSSYLNSVLESQSFAKNDPELSTLQDTRLAVEKVLRNAFPDCAATIKYGGSYAKGTLNRSAYDLDLVNFFPRDQNGAGETLEEIFKSVQAALAKHYLVVPKTSALRIEEHNGKEHTYTHIDVVPGRFVDDKRADVFLYQRGTEKCRLKTNTKTHVTYIRDSGFVPAIRLVKLWREGFGGFSFKTFVLELLVIKVLKDAGASTLDAQLRAFWETLRDKPDSLHVEDPANPNGNDLSEYLGTNKRVLSIAAETALRTLEVNGWEGVFGSTKTVSGRKTNISALPTIRSWGTKPWA